MPMNRKVAALATVAVAGALLAAGPAEAAQSAKPSAPKSDGAKAICKHLPKTEDRIAKALTRLGGDATVPGSIARLQVRVDDAKAAGHTAIYTYLNDRLTFRKSLVPTLQTERKDLKAVADWCSAQGLSHDTDGSAGTK